MSPSTPCHRLVPKLSYVGNKIKVELHGGCLKQDKVTFNHRTIVNIYIAYELTNFKS